MASPAPPAILQIYREPLRPGSDAAYDAIEVEVAQAAARLGCPNPYLGAESSNGSKEVWWFNGYESDTRKQQVYDAYAKNTQLMAALQRSSEQKKSLTFAPIDVLANFRPELSVGSPWILGEGRFLVASVGTGNTRATGTVFESADGTRFVFRSARSREEAEALREAMSEDARVLAVRPSWSFPARGWIASDPEFW